MQVIICKNHDKRPPDSSNKIKYSRVIEKSKRPASITGEKYDIDKLLYNTDIRNGSIIYLI